MVSFSREERNRIISDIVAWKVELENGNGGLSDAEYDEYVQTLIDLSDDDLYSWWETNVGEWILSRDGIFRAYETDDGEEILESEFETLRSGGSTKYGYLGGRPSIRFDDYK